MDGTGRGMFTSGLWLTDLAGSLHGREEGMGNCAAAPYFLNAARVEEGKPQELQQPQFGAAKP